MPEHSFRVEMAGDVPVVVKTLVVDMSRTEFCDTAGIHALVATHKQAADDGREVRLVVTSAAVLRIFAITGFDQVISSFSRLDQALAAP